MKIVVAYGITCPKCGAKAGTWCYAQPRQLCFERVQEADYWNTKLRTWNGKRSPKRPEPDQ